MKLDDPALIEDLAARYVLGSMRGSARRRFEREMARSMAATEAVWRWERRLSSLNDSLLEIRPPDRAWRRIESGLDRDKRANRWATLALAASVFFAAVGLAMFWSTSSPDQRVAVVQSEQHPQWVIELNVDEGELTSRALNVQAAELDQVYELWTLSPEGTPTSLGLLPVANDATRHRMTPLLLRLLLRSQTLAVSREPAGGSPEAGPTGPVLFTAELLTL